MSEKRAGDTGRAVSVTHKAERVQGGYKPTTAVARPSTPTKPPEPPAGQGGGSKSKAD